MNKESGSKGPWQSTLRYSHLGIQFSLTILIFVLAGHWGDDELGTRPLLILLGLALGFGAAFYLLYREVYRNKRG